MKKALIITHTGFQDHELVYPYYFLLGEGFETHIVADKKDELGRCYGIFGLNMPCHITLKEFADNLAHYHQAYDVIVLPGGVKALEKLRLNKAVLEFIRDWDASGKLIISTCHGAQLLISAKIVAGRKISGYYSLEDDVNNAGAVYVNAPYVIDKNIISSPHYDHMGVWMKEAVNLYHEINGSQNSN
jgi:protease I